MRQRLEQEHLDPGLAVAGEDVIDRGLRGSRLLLTPSPITRLK